MIRQEICYTNLNVKIACSHGGLTPANDGASHQAIEDMGVLRTIPNMTVIQPADYVSARKLVRAAGETYGPMFLRFTRDAVPVVYDEDAQFVIGKANKPARGQGRGAHRRGRHAAPGHRGGAGPARAGHRGPGARHAHDKAPGRGGGAGLHRGHRQDRDRRGPQQDKRPGQRGLRVVAEAAAA